MTVCVCMCVCDVHVCIRQAYGKGKGPAVWKVWIRGGAPRASLRRSPQARQANPSIPFPPRRMVTSCLPPP